MDARSGHGAYRISTPSTSSSQDKSHPMSSVPDSDAVALSVRCARRASPVSVVAEEGKQNAQGCSRDPSLTMSTPQVPLARTCSALTRDPPLREGSSVPAVVVLSTWS